MGTIYNPPADISRPPQLKWTATIAIKRVYGTVYGNLVGNVSRTVIGSIKGLAAGRIECSVVGHL